MTLDEDRSILWQKMYEVVSRHLVGRRAAVADQLGISFIKAKALRRLALRPMTMGELTTALNTDPPYATLLADDLVQRGLVARGTDPTDRRRKLVALTTDGTRTAAAAERILDEPPVEFDHLGPDDLQRLLEMFDRMSDAELSPK